MKISRYAEKRGGAGLPYLLMLLVTITANSDENCIGKSMFTVFNFLLYSLH